MIIKEVRIRNFKSFDSEGASIPITPLTALVGENSGGKSNIIEAIDLFHNYSKTKISLDSFYAHDLARKIQIQVTYRLSDASEFRECWPYLSVEKDLVLVQCICGCPEVQDGDAHDNFELDAAVDLDPEEEILLYPIQSGIEWLDQPPTRQADVKALWSETLEVNGIDIRDWSGLPTDSPPTKDQLRERIIDFWYEHWDDIPNKYVSSESVSLTRRSGKFPVLPDVFHIPAVQTIDDVARTSRGSPLGHLLDYVVDSLHPEVQRAINQDLLDGFRKAISRLPKDQEDEDGTPITLLEVINQTFKNNMVGDFLQDELEVYFEKPDLNRLLWGSVALRADDGFVTDISEKGPGFQRAAALAIMRAYLELRDILDEGGSECDDVVFLIEEPEIFLHPTLKRSAYSLFRQLAGKGDQVIYSTHDGYMLSVLRFEEIRRVTRDREVEPAPVTCVHDVGNDVLVDVWCQICDKESIDLQSIRDRLDNVYDPYRNEGFLSSKILLCEGETERHALPIYFRAIGFDLDRHGVALVDAGGVDLLDYFYLLFTELGIPTYVIWDSDTPQGVDDIDVIQSKDEKRDIQGKSHRNKSLADLVGIPIPSREDGACFWSEETVCERGAVLPFAYKQTMMTTLSDSDEVKGKAKRLYGTDSKPLVARFYAKKAVSRGREEGDAGKYVPDFVEQVVSNPKSLQEPQKQSVIRGIRA